MQHLGAAGGDLLRFVVMQRAQQARASACERGLALNMPGTSVQISIGCAPQLRAEVAPPRCRSRRGPAGTVLPSLSRAMKPCVMTTGVEASSRCSSAASGANEQVADSTDALAEAPRSSAASMSRASIQVTSMPCDLRKRAPISVAMSSPLAITRARVRSDSSRTSAMPLAIWRSSSK